MGDLQDLSERLFKWMLIAGAAGVLDPCSTDTLSVFSRDVYVSEIGSTNQSEAAANGASDLGVAAQAGVGIDSIEAQVALYRDARAEAEVAHRLLQGLRTQIGLPEVNEYIGHLDEIVSATPDDPTPDQTRLFSHSLRAARAQLVNQAGSFATWLMIAELLNPNGGPHSVPSRFVRWENPADDSILADVASKARVRRALASFLRDDADPGSGRA
jgi:hypothetical protein